LSCWVIHEIIIQKLGLTCNPKSRLEVEFNNPVQKPTNRIQDFSVKLGSFDFIHQMAPRLKGLYTPNAVNQYPKTPESTLNHVNPALKVTTFSPPYVSTRVREIGSFTPE